VKPNQKMLAIRAMGYVAAALVYYNQKYPGFMQRSQVNDNWYFSTHLDERDVNAGVRDVARESLRTLLGHSL
jgi:hypothetical protein